MAEPFRSVGDVLREYFGRHGLARRVKQAAVVHEWDEIVGPRIAAVTTPTAVDAAGTLWVRVASAAWQQELQLMSREILRALAARGRTVREIRWVAGSDRPAERP